MDFKALVLAMSPDTYQSLLETVATGRWADGVALSEQQKSHTQQLVMAYQAKILRSDEPFTIGADGQMVIKSKTEMKAQFSAEQSIARFAHDDL